MKIHLSFLFHLINATLFHFKTGNHHLLGKCQVFDNEEGKYLLRISWMSDTELGLKLSFGGSLINVLVSNAKKQQKTIKQNKEWISSKLDFLIFYFT